MVHDIFKEPEFDFYKNLKYLIWRYCPNRIRATQYQEKYQGCKIVKEHLYYKKCEPTLECQKYITDRQFKVFLRKYKIEKIKEHVCTQNIT